MSACTHDGNCEVDHAAEEDAMADALAAGRHPKWVRVEPGTVIPAGQPYRVEYPKGAGGDPIGVKVAADYLGNEMEWRSPSIEHRDHPREWFVDSSWKPPLVLPTEPTTGLLLTAVCEWRVVTGALDGGWFANRRVENILDFIPLTDEQVARIEAAR